MPSRTVVKEREIWGSASFLAVHREREREINLKAAATIWPASRHRQTQILMMWLFENEMGNNSFPAIYVLLLLHCSIYVNFGILYIHFYCISHIQWNLLWTLTCDVCIQFFPPHTMINLNDFFIYENEYEQKFSRMNARRYQHGG